MWKKIVITMASVLMATLSSQVATTVAHAFPVPPDLDGGNGTGNGGEFLRQAFAKSALLGLDLLEQDPELREDPKILAMISALRIEVASIPVFVKGKVFAHGAEVAAVNYRSRILRSDPNFPFEATVRDEEIPERLIVVGEDRWTLNDAHPIEQMSIALHEYMGCANMGDIYYRISSVLLAYLQKSVGAAEVIRSLNPSAKASDDSAFAPAKDNVAFYHLPVESNEDLDSCHNACDTGYARAESCVGDSAWTNNAVRSNPVFDSYFDFLFEVTQFRRCYTLCEENGRMGSFAFELKGVMKDYPKDVFEKRYQATHPAPPRIDDHHPVLALMAGNQRVEFSDLPKPELGKNVTHGTFYPRGSEQWNNITNYLASMYFAAPERARSLGAFIVGQTVTRYDRPYLSYATHDPFIPLVEAVEQGLVKAVEQGKDEGDRRPRLDKAEAAMLDNYSGIILAKRTHFNKLGKPWLQSREAFHFRFDPKTGDFLSMDRLHDTKGLGFLGFVNSGREELEAFRPLGKQTRKQVIDDLSQATRQRFEFCHQYLKRLK